MSLTRKIFKITLLSIIWVQVFGKLEFQYQYHGFDFLDYGDNWIWDDIALCKTSTQSSPVDLGSRTYKHTKALSLIGEHFQCKATAMYFNTTIKIISQNKTHGFGLMYFSDLLGGMQPLKAGAIEFRFPAAHTFQNQTVRYPIEMQIKYVDFYQQNHEEIIISVMFDYGKEPDRILNQLTVNQTVNNTVVLIDLNPYLEKINEQKFFYYFGTQDTPPCHSQVHWFILEKPFQATQKQIQYFQKLFDSETNPNFQGLHGNIRKIQSWNDKAQDVFVYVHEEQLEFKQIDL